MNEALKAHQRKLVGHGAAAALPMANLPEEQAKKLTDIVMLDGWSSVLFYFFGNFAPSRGLSFGPNKHGKTNIFGIIALGPAYLFGVLSLWALYRLGVAAFAAPAQPADADDSAAGDAQAAAADGTAGSDGTASRPQGRADARAARS